MALTLAALLGGCSKETVVEEEAQNKEIHEVNHQLAEDNGKLIP